MSDIEKRYETLLAVYLSGRYQCDLSFYQSLKKIIVELQMLDLIELIEPNYHKLEQIHKLTEQNSFNSLTQQFDQSVAHQKSKLIKKLLNQLSPIPIQKAINKIKLIKCKSYSYHIAQLILKFGYNPKYQQIYSRIVSSITNDPKIRLQHLLTLGFFMLRHKENIINVIDMYNKTVCKGLQLMKIFRNNIKFINNSTDSSYYSQIKHNLKFKQYCFGTFFIYNVLLKICQLLKILEGKNNFTLKLNTYKSQFEEVFTIWPEIKFRVQQIQKQNFQFMPLKQFRQLFLGEKKGIQFVNRSCMVCLRCIDIKTNSNALCHDLCQQIVKQLNKQ